MDDAKGRLARFRGYLEQDPNNLALIADAADAALAAGEAQTAQAWIARYAGLAPLPPSVQVLSGLAAIQGQDYGQAIDIFRNLLAAEPRQPQLSFNLAWALMMQRDWAAALGVVDALPDPLAPETVLLKVRLLHRLGRLDEALAFGEAHAKADPALAAALSVAAIDAERPDLAHAYARSGGDNPEALATLGALSLADSQVGAAARLFDQALAGQPDNARAHLGRGLCQLLAGDAGAAAGELDRCAALFGDHLGSWVAAGWAYLVAGDLAAARARFETALTLDDTFAETQGALAVIDILSGQIESGRRRAEVAARLDRRCFASALAKMLLAQGAGDVRTAEQIRRIALNSPIGADGRTIASTMAALAMVRRRH